MKTPGSNMVATIFLFLSVSFRSKYHQRHFIAQKPQQKTERSMKYCIGNWSSTFKSHPVPLLNSISSLWHSYLICLVLTLSSLVKWELKYYTLFWGSTIEGLWKPKRPSKYATINWMSWVLYLVPLIITTNYFSGSTSVINGIDPSVQVFCNNYNLEKLIWQCTTSTLLIRKKIILVSSFKISLCI